MFYLLRVGLPVMVLPKFPICATTCACPSCILSKLELVAIQKYRLCFVPMSGTILPKSGSYLIDY